MTTAFLIEGLRSDLSQNGWHVEECPAIPASTIATYITQLAPDGTGKAIRISSWPDAESAEQIGGDRYRADNDDGGRSELDAAVHSAGAIMEILKLAAHADGTGSLPEDLRKEVEDPSGEGHSGAVSALVYVGKLIHAYQTPEVPSTDPRTA